MTAAAAGGLRRPLFVLAAAAAVLVVLVEVGLPVLLLDGPPTRASPDAATALGVPEALLASSGSEVPQPPGAGIGFLAFIDGLLLFSVLMVGLSLLMPLRIYGRLQGIVTLVVSLLWILMCLLAGMAALATLMLMIGLFVSAPFGTLAYLAIWGSFSTGDAAVLLGLLLFLKVCFLVLLVLSQPRFLRVKGLMALAAVSVVLQLVLGFIHGFLPGPVVAIGDHFWAIVTAVVALVWALVMLVFSVPAIINAIRSSTAAGDA
ncbi:integral membrane protein [Arthrobacter crystallopoietes BAB-32]|uniref:Integral membrane protein n=1 Tax=Arthrobacter crystallopoietes BAB-32 TaxID=1246476 RepID=N1V6Y8_9MICC|nr:hypothetical protein [Arthrobacter crystallopoietes]EMY35862.1 integral membrane protein [Arthrobacter crystallopoietes BAB-32]